LAILLKLAGYPFIAKVVFSSLWALKLGIRIAAPMITKDKRWPEMIAADLSRTTLESFLLSIKSLRKTDLVGELKNIQVPILGMFGAKDNIVSPRQKDVLQREALHPSIAYFTNAGHFPMLDEPENFMKTLKDFLDEDNPIS
jgi:pimeloyl-ACP methyl ester carboxylesterase